MSKQQLLTIKEASQWASKFLDRDVSESNISYLVQYGKIRKHIANKSVAVYVCDLKAYYNSYHGKREINWKRQLGKDLNWGLSFDHLREKDTTKHVHRLHPYKGKFIPQLVDYFIGNQTDAFKKKNFFQKGNIILDPFSGSGTTLVQAKELDLHSIGIDISRFNSMIAEVKLSDYNFSTLNKDITKIKYAIANYETKNNITAFEKELMEKLYSFNKKNFPSPDFKYQVQRGSIDEETFSKIQNKKFLKIYNDLVKKI